MNLLSDQVDKKEIEVIVRELKRTINSGVAGDVVEFGCYVGTTSVYLAQTLMDDGDKKRLYVYDSFQGLPEKSKDDISPLGESFKPGELFVAKKQFIKNMVQSRVTMPKITKAWFSELTDGDLPEKVSFAFLDGDYYASVKVSLRLIEKRLIPGSVIIVDDYANSALPGAAKAVDEWLIKHSATKKVEQSLAILYL